MSLKLQEKYVSPNQFLLQAPKKDKRDARLFVTFRPSEKISNEISTTSGYEFNKNNSVLAASGNNKFKFDIKQQGFAG